MIKRITAKNFSKYGTVIEYPSSLPRRKGENLFCIVMKEPKPLGWRIAYLVVRDRKINTLEQHPHTFESFEPVKGRSVLYVACRKDPASVEAFYLDVPVVLKKGVWHGVVALGVEADIKITENADVKCVYWSLGRALAP